MWFAVTCWAFSRWQPQWHHQAHDCHCWEAIPGRSPRFSGRLKIEEKKIYRQMRLCHKTPPVVLIWYSEGEERKKELVKIIVKSESPKWVVTILYHCAFNTDFLANSYFILYIWWGILHLHVSHFENMWADFVLRCQNLISQTTPEIMHFQAGKKYLNQ